jgi:UDP-glucuronate 4-epimerase
MARDYTYINDIVDGILGALAHIPKVATDHLHPVYNLGNHHSESLMGFIEILEKSLNITAIKNFLPLQDGDVPVTSADISAAARDFGYAPSTRIHTGIPLLVAWYKEYNQLL